MGPLGNIQSQKYFEMGIRLFFAFLSDCLCRIFSCFYFFKPSIYKLFSLWNSADFSYALYFAFSFELIDSLRCCSCWYSFLSSTFLFPREMFSDLKIVLSRMKGRCSDRTTKMEIVWYSHEKKSQNLIEFPRSSYNRHNSKNVFRVYFIVHISCQTHTDIHTNMDAQWMCKWKFLWVVRLKHL